MSPRARASPLRASSARPQLWVARSSMYLDRSGVKVVAQGPCAVPYHLCYLILFLQISTFYEWAMLDLNQRPPPCKRQKHVSGMFVSVQKILQISLFSSAAVLCVHRCSGALSSNCRQPASRLSLPSTTGEDCAPRRSPIRNTVPKTVCEAHGFYDLLA